MLTADVTMQYDPLPIFLASAYRAFLITPARHVALHDAPTRALLIKYINGVKVATEENCPAYAQQSHQRLAGTCLEDSPRRAALRRYIVN